ncbi:hypothetical protein PYH58_08170 [Mammaliicoccus sciuri]|uniref:hypothetical protein n=1 Tax=Mammaliicoccus sciuri TaxID=1296 RepID=UPI003364B541
MRSIFMGLLATWIVSLLFRITNTDIKNEWDYAFFLLVFIVAAISQLIKQAKEE